MVHPWENTSFTKGLPKENKLKILRKLTNTDSGDVIPDELEERCNDLRYYTNARQCGLVPQAPSSKTFNKTEQYKITKNNSAPTKINEMSVESVPNVEKMEIITPSDDWAMTTTKDMREILNNIEIQGLLINEDKQFQDDYLGILNKVDDKDKTTCSEHDVKCEKCKFKTTSKRNLRVHMKLVHDFKFFSCNICGTKAKTKENLKRHVFNKHKVDITTESEMNLKMHKKEIHSSELKQISKGPLISNFSCNICKSKFKSKPGLARHKTTRHVKNTDQTKEKTKGPKRLVDKFTCTHCSSKFTTTVTLKKHIENKHSKSEGNTSQTTPPQKKIMQSVKEKCALCVMTFPTKLRLITHMKMVHNAAKNKKEKEKEYEAIIIQLKVKINEKDDIINKLQHQVETKIEAKKTPETTHPQPLETIVNRIDIVETMEMSQEDTDDEDPDDETKEEINDTSNYDEFKTPKEFIVRNNWKVSCHICEVVLNSKELLSEHVKKEHQASKGLELEKEATGRKEQVEDMDWEEITSNKTKKIETSANKVDDSNEKLDKKFRFSEMIMCDRCEGIFKNNKMFKDHKMLEHKDSETEDGDYTCNDCPFQTNSKSGMNNHNKQTKHMSIQNKAVEDYICVACGTEYESSNELRVHLCHAKVHQCNFCNLKFMTRQLLKRHILNIHNINVEDLYKIQANNTYDNDFNSVDHMDTDEPDENPSSYPCRFCKKTFRDQQEIANHRRLAHKTYKPCKNIAMCTFGPNCYYSHDPIPDGKFRCFQCGNIFQSTNDMMLHRKNLHENIKICKKFIKNECDRGDICWWSHKINNNQNKDFQRAPINLEPPLWTGKPMIQTQAQIDPIMLQILKKLEEDMIQMKNIMRNQNQEMINLKATIMN